MGGDGGREGMEIKWEWKWEERDGRQREGRGEGGRCEGGRCEGERGEEGEWKGKERWQRIRRGNGNRGSKYASLTSSKIWDELQYRSFVNHRPGYPLCYFQVISGVEVSHLTSLVLHGRQ